MKADLRRMGNRTQARRGRSAWIGDHAKVWRRTAAITSAYVNPSSIRRPAASPARATEPESAARPATASAAIAHQCVASGEVGRHECRPLAAASRGSQHSFAAPRRQSGIGAAIDTMGGSFTMPRWRSPRRQPRSDCNWAKAASISRGDNRPGGWLPGQHCRPGHAGPVTTTECRRAEQVQPGRTSHTRRWLGCPVSMGLRALRHHSSPKHSALPRSVVVDPHIASGEQYVDRLVFTSRSPQPVVAAEQLPASLCERGDRLVLRLVLFVDEPQLLEGARSGLRDGRWRTVRHPAAGR